jgi:hypothetical protein
VRQPWQLCVGPKLRTWRLVGVVFWEAHLGLEVSSIVQGVWVDDDQGDGPVVEVFLIAELHTSQ